MTTPTQPTAKEIATKMLKFIETHEYELSCGNRTFGIKNVEQVCQRLLELESENSSNRIDREALSLQRKEIVKLREQLTLAQSELKAAKERNGKLEEALKFYANRDSWKIEGYSGEVKEVIEMSDLGCKSFNGENDFADYAIPSGGRRAREALRESDKRGEGEEV